MEDMRQDVPWPEVPPELKYSELRLPWTFRDLVASRAFTNEEIGRIVRCIALNTEMFITPEIEPEVHYYCKHQKLKQQVRKRVEALRRRRLMFDEKDYEHDVNCVTNCVTVTHDEKSTEPSESAKSPLEKTPPIPEEKRPPIVPLEKKSPSLLEKKKRGRSKKRVDIGTQQDLFDVAAGVFSSTSTADGQKRPQEPSVAPAKENAHQDIERAPSPSKVPSETMPTGTDSRIDAAWIPQRFAAFWEKYPKKVAKQAAMKAFSKIIKAQPDVDVFMKVLMASLEWWKSRPNWQSDGGNYIPHPATWLNRGSWEDSVDNKKVSSGSAEFLERSSDSDEDLIRRMTGG